MGDNNMELRRPISIELEGHVQHVAKCILKTHFLIISLRNEFNELVKDLFALLKCNVHD